jgi:hypothetical protein
MRRPIILLLLLAATTFACAQTQEPKANFTGTWVFDAQKSKLTVPAPSAMTLNIKQDNEQISFVRNQTFGDQSFAWKLDGTIGNQQPVEDKGPGYTTATRLYWQSNGLVIDQKITASDGTKVSDVVTYTMVDNGNSLQAYESQTTIGGKGANNNRWIYDRKAQ